MKIYGAIRTVLFWALAALALVFVATLAEIEVLRYFIGGLMVLYGVEEILYTVFKNKRHFVLHGLFWNVTEVIIGLVLIVFVETGDVEVTYAVVCASWAIWSILREARELYELVKELKEHKLIPCKIVAVLNLVESLTVIALSLTMLIEPGEHHAKIHLYLLAVELFTKALFPLIEYVAHHVHERKVAKAEAEAPEAVCSEEGQAELPPDGEPQETKPEE